MPYKHVIADLYNCEPDALLWSLSEAFRMTLVEQVAEVSQVLDGIWHNFDNDAYTGVLLLAESHCSIHTWPELQKVHFDLFTCGDADCEQAFKAIRVYLQTTPSELDCIHIVRRT
jgi:S-adenosylmethionine decarboxylase